MLSSLRHHLARIRSSRDTPSSQSSDLVSDIALLSMKGPSERKYVGESSRVYVGRFALAVLPTTDYEHEQGSLHSQLRIRVNRSSEGTSLDGQLLRQMIDALLLSIGLQMGFRRPTSHIGGKAYFSFVDQPSLRSTSYQVMCMRDKAKQIMHLSS